MIIILKFSLVFIMTISSVMTYSQNTMISYTYEKAGNRTSRKPIVLDPPPSNAPILSNNIDRIYVADKFDEIGIKTYPNPASGRLKTSFQVSTSKKSQQL